MTTPDEAQALLPVRPELLPCPFCWTSAHLSYQWPGSMTADMPDRPCRVICSHIDHDTVVGPTGYGKRAAITAWNHRISHSLPGDVGTAEQRAKHAAETWRVPDHRDPAKVTAMVRPKDDCVYGFEQGYLAALTPSALPGGEVECPDCDGHGFIAPLKNMPETAEGCETCEGVGYLPSALSGDAGEAKHQFVPNPLMPFSSCQFCLAPEDAAVHAQPESMAGELMDKLRSALRFAASRSVLSSSDEQAILAAFAKARGEVA